MKKLKTIEDDLIKRTDNFTTENLERIYTKLMEVVSMYKKTYDRTQLPKDITDKIENLRLLPPKVSPTKKKTSLPAQQ